MTADKWAGLSLAELLAVRESLNARIEEVRAADRQAAIAQVRELVAEYGLTPKDVMPSSPSPSVRHTAKKAPAKYYDADTGKTWSGRGKPPRWIAGRDFAAFLIPAEGILRQLAQQHPVAA